MPGPKGPCGPKPKAPAAMAIMKGGGSVGGPAGRSGDAAELVVVAEPAGCGGELITRHYKSHKKSPCHMNSKCQMRTGGKLYFTAYSFSVARFAVLRKRGEKGRRLFLCERKYAVRRTYVLAHM